MHTQPVILYACNVPIHCMKAGEPSNTTFCTRKPQLLASVSVFQSSFMVFLFFKSSVNTQSVSVSPCREWFKRKICNAYCGKHIDAFCETSGKMICNSAVQRLTAWLVGKSCFKPTSYKIYLAPIHVFRIQKPFTGFCKIHISTFHLRLTLYFDTWHAESCSAHCYGIRSCGIHVFLRKKKREKKSAIYF